MKATMFWPAVMVTFVLGLALAAYGLLCMAGAAQGGADEVFLYLVVPGLLLAGAALVAIVGRAARAAWRRWRS